MSTYEMYSHLKSWCHGSSMNRIELHKPILFQSLKFFVQFHSPTYYARLVKVFYTNLKIRVNGHIFSEVKPTKIIIKPADWITLCNLSYEGQKLFFQIITENLEVLNFMIRPNLHCWMIRMCLSMCCHFDIQILLN